MEILFNVCDVGLGNNGGSLTLIKSANQLIDLGVNVKVIDSGRNQHTWAKLLADHIIVKSPSEFPSADVIVATGMKSISSTLASRIPLKLHWIRGWETWVYPERKLVKIFRKSSTVKIVNSICLEDRLKSYKMKSYIIRPGYDFEDYYPTNLRSDTKIILGGIYNEGAKRKTKRVDWIFRCFSSLKNKYKNIELWMYGTENAPCNGLVSFYKKDPSEAEKNFIYNNVSVWLSSSCLEGLHMPPAEAGLTQCCIVGTEAEMSGTQDYLTHNVTGLVSKDDLNSFTRMVEYSISNKNMRDELGKRLRTKIISLEDRKNNMNKLIELIKKLKGEE